MICRNELELILIKATYNINQSQVHGIDIDYKADILYVQGWGGVVKVLDIGFIENCYKEDSETAADKIFKEYKKQQSKFPIFLKDVRII